MNDLVVAIHQPNFLPWLGYFAKIARADVFVLLDTAQFPKKGGTWINRVRMAINGEPAWITVPVVRAYHGYRSIAEMRIDERTPWRARLIRTIELNYRRAPHFETLFPWLTQLIENPTDRLADYNEAAIRAFCGLLGVDPSKLVSASVLPVTGSATELLIGLTKAAGASTYMCGGGAEGYQDDEKFAAAGLKLIYQKFEHPAYPQGSASIFTPGLSIVDALMHCGPAGTAVLLGRRTAPNPAAD